MAEQEDNRSANAPWSESELRTSIDAYLYLLQLEASGVPFSVIEQEKLLASGPLSNRNEASVRYRLRNISQIMQERGEATLKAYSAAPQVGKNVKARIHGLLDERQSTLRAIGQMGGNRGAEVVGLEDVLTGLSQLKEMISSLAPEPRPVAGIGHNNPPENIVLGADDFSEAVRAISRIESAVSGDAPDIDTVERSSNILVTLGMKSALWAGQRLTDFAKAGAVAAGTGAGLSLYGLGGQIVETLHRVFTYLF
ncbi:hypothetical protein [Puniceibacterium sediminis]|uniref:Uncharacterized protein n=1 Tax=Puniceibacterium sediminis TaxID=1608407 RepID=A0A238VL68_9RHOB|nr:hypothetical protein [Puniceibacterium sediminis]SNR35112.1 hypothetical protein SAMN06265370_102348 [Puniceibacterium sediminis]